MTISAKVLKVLQAEHISPEELRQMLDEVAYTSLRGCNRRYFQWLFLVSGNQVQDMQRVEVTEVGHGQNRMTEEHDDCDGDGCRECGWSGIVSRAVEDRTAHAMQRALTNV